MPPAINVDQGRARAWGSLADSTFRMSVRVDDRLDEQAAIDGMREGMSGDLNSGLMFQPTVKGRAFTQQATKSYWQNLEATARLRMDEIAAANRQDPQGMQAAVDSYIDTTTATLPDEFKGKAKNYLTSTSRSYIAKARADLVKQRAAQAEAAGLLAERSATLEIDRLSSGLFSPDPEVAAAAAVGLEAVRARLGALYGSTVTDDLGNQVPVFSPEQKAKAAIMLEERTAKGTLTGWYNEQPNKIQALRAINAGQVRAPLTENGKVVGEYNPLSSLGTEERDKLISKLRGAYSTELGIQSKLQAMADRRRKLAEEAAIVDIIREGTVTPGGPTIGRALVMLDHVTSPALARELHGIITTGAVSGQVSDNPTFNLAKIDALQGRFDVTADIPGLPVKARVELFEINKRAVEQNRTSRAFEAGDFRDTRDLIAAQFGYLDFEALRVRKDLGESNPRLNSALEHLQALHTAAFDSSVAGETLDAKTWYLENVGTVASEKAGTIAELQTQLRDVESSFRARADVLTQQGVPVLEKRKDAEYQRLRDEKVRLRRALKEAAQ